MNVWKQFRDLAGAAPLQSGTVTAHHPDGSSTVQLPGGALLRATGLDVAVGSRALIQGGTILRGVPPLAEVEVEV